jgi:hypothetical protein
MALMENSARASEGISMNGKGDADWLFMAESLTQTLSEPKPIRMDPVGMDKGDARSRLIVSNVTLKEFQNGTPPCHARFEDLYQIGIEAGTIPGRRKGQLNGEIFRNGIIEAIIELGRQRQVLENDCAQVERTSSSTVMPGVETGPRLVH